jgi:hypothetical protein
MKRGRPEALSLSSRRELYDTFVRVYPFWFDVLRLVPRFRRGDDRRILFDTTYALSGWSIFTGREKEAAKRVLKDLFSTAVGISTYQSSKGRSSPRYLALWHSATILGVPLVGIRQMERYIEPFRKPGDTDVTLTPLPTIVKQHRADPSSALPSPSPTGAGD